jgi:DNA polymerase III subunit beta
MKIRIPRHDLYDAVNKVKTVVSGRSALPILAHILIETSESAIRLTATDLKVSIECLVDCAVDEPGSLTVSSHRLSSILNELPDSEITLTLQENNVVLLKCGRSETRLFSMSPDEFPPIRSFEGVEPLVLRQAVLKKLFGKTSFAICTDQARYNLTGLLFELKEGRLTVVATDGRRMSMCSETEDIPEGIELKVIVPGKMISELERLLGDEGEANVYIDETQAAVSFGSVRLVTALIEGAFPNYEMVIPKKHDKEAHLNTEAFIEAVRRTRTMTNDKFNSVRFHLHDGTLTLKVVTPEVGEHVEDMAVDYSAEEVEIAFNPDFILDIVRHVDTEQVALVLKDAGNPGLLKPFTADVSGEYLNVIMPIRI